MPKISRIFIIASQNAQLEHNSERSWLDKRSTYSDTPVKKRSYFLLNKKKKKPTNYFLPHFEINTRNLFNCNLEKWNIE